MKIHVMGAGNVGGSIIRAAVRAGHSVTVGVRQPDKIRELLEETGASLSEQVGDADLIISTLPHAAAAEVLPTLGLEGRILVETSNPLTWAGGPVHTPPEGYRSGAEHLQALLPGTHVVKGFNTFGAEHTLRAAEGERPLDHLIAGDNAEAKDKVAELLRSMKMRPIDLGPLRNAATLEHFAVAWIHLAMPGGWGRSIQLAVLDG